MLQEQTAAKMARKIKKKKKRDAKLTENILSGEIA